MFKFYKPIKQFSYLQGSWDVNDGKTNRQPYLFTLFNRTKINIIADKRQSGQIFGADKRRSGQMSEHTNVGVFKCRRRQLSNQTKIWSKISPRKTPMLTKMFQIISKIFQFNDQTNSKSNILSSLAFVTLILVMKPIQQQSRQHLTHKWLGVGRSIYFSLSYTCIPEQIGQN